MTSSALQEIVALLGSPAAGNPAQYLFERALNSVDLDWRFLTLDVEGPRLGDALAGIEALGFRGCLLAQPLQEAALQCIENTTPSARFSGGVSNITRSPDGLVGHMTEGRGIIEALRHHVDPASQNILIFGGNTVAKATALELILAGCPKITLCDSNGEHVRSVVTSLNELGANHASSLEWESIIEIPAEIDIVISTLSSEAFADDVKGFRKELIVADTALSTDASLLLKSGAETGSCVVNGLEIYAEKTAIDFQTWTNLLPDIDMLREALDEFLDA
ncbi:MAG: hypothetical protein ABGW78_15795 [Pirellulales bacterium]